MNVFYRKLFKTLWALILSLIWWLLENKIKQSPFAATKVLLQESPISRYSPMFLSLAILISLCVCLCSADNLRLGYLFDGEKTFLKQGTSNNPTTDKITTHNYQKMYGTILLPMIEKFESNKKQLKFLEIGLGCGMIYGPGASVKLWQQIFEGRNVDLWEAEFDAECVEKAKKAGQLEGIKVVTGDQADPKVLKRWIKETGGKFDVIIDDGGHKSDQVINSFNALWPELNPDGNYFIEDLQIAYNPGWNKPGIPPVTRIIQAWVEFLNVGEVHEHHQHILSKYPVPAGLDSVHCQKDACVLHKEP